MSAFAPINVAAGQQQKRELLAKLMQQYQQHAARASGLAGNAGAASAPNVGASSTSGHNQYFGGRGSITSEAPNFTQSLIDRLGPGGFGHGIRGYETSPDPGSSIVRGYSNDPRAGGGLLSPGPIHNGMFGGPAMPVPMSPNAPAPGAPTQNVGGVTFAGQNPANMIPTNPDTTGMSPAAALAAQQAANQAMVVYNQGVANGAPTGGGSGVIPLGNNLGFHPDLGIIPLAPGVNRAS